MVMWDGLQTKETERVLVLAATNRPFDLDDAVLRRMPRRMLVDLPDEKNREQILRVILSKERLSDDFNFGAVAQMTEGYSGSDLKNLCIAAAYIPIRELLKKEKKDQSKGIQSLATSDKIRALKITDFEEAKKEFSASVSENAQSVAELRRWNEMYGEGGKDRSSLLPYFL